MYQQDLSRLYAFLQEGESGGHVTHAFRAMVGIGEHAGCFVVAEEDERLFEPDVKELEEWFET